MIKIIIIIIKTTGKSIVIVNFFTPNAIHEVFSKV